MKFWKVFLAALLAVVTGSVLSGLIWLSMILGIAGSVGEKKVVAEESILTIDMADNISDAPSSNPLANIDFMTMETSRHFTLLQTLRAIEAAKEDPKIKGIYINTIGGGEITMAAVEEMRAAILDFKTSGKFVVAYNDNYSQFGYYLATVADKIYVQPQGGVAWLGISANLSFYKNAMDKLGISVEAFRPTACKYKSAVEPYILTKMSDANRTQMQAMCDDIWAVVLDAVSESRGIDKKELNRLADNLNIVLAEDALKYNFVDGLLYADQMNDIFEEYGVKKNSDNEFEKISLGDYCANLPADLTKLAAPKVGIVYAEGEIVMGEGGNGDKIYGSALAATLAKARKDDSIKAVVLRVNSPGGSALASDIIWREVELLKAQKPVIVSMGSYAASGGYYISCPADAILSDRLTLTGSIGVFGMMMEGGNMLRNKLGITFDGVKTNSEADCNASFMGLFKINKCTALERKTLLRTVDKIYETFTTNVANGRNLPLEKVLEIAQGRVWSGDRARTIGLVDAEGGLTAAIGVAAEKAGIADNFDIFEVKGDLPPFAALMEQLNVRIHEAFTSEEVLAAEREIKAINDAFARQGVQAYCPYVVEM